MGDTDWDGPEGDRPLSDQEQEDFLRADPFADAQDPGEAQGEEEHGKGHDQEEAQGEPEAKADEEVDPHAQTIQSLREELNQLRSQLAEKPAEKAAEGEGEKRDEIPSYDVDIPDSVITAINSGSKEQVKRGLQAIIKGTSQNVHRMLLKEMQEKILPETETRVTSTVQGQTQAEAIQRDFFSHFGELNDPALHPLIAQTTQEVVRELGAQSWNETVRNTVGKRVKERLARYSGSSASSSPVKGKGGKPPKQFSGGNRPGGMGQRDEQSNMMAEILGDGFA